MTEFTGRCLCGKISYRAKGPTAFVACHCRDCRYTSGGAPANILVVQQEAFELLTGADLVQGFTVEAESGHKVTREFCKSCGTPLFEKLEILEPDAMLVKVGTVDQQEDLRVEATAWTKSAPAWAHIDTHARTFDENPADEFIGQLLQSKAEQG